METSGYARGAQGVDRACFECTPEGYAKKATPAKVFVAEPSELFRFKCINHHLQRPDDLKCPSNGTTHGSVGSTPDATTVTQDRSRLYSYKVNSRYITAQAFIT
jgi:hypothetical protein